MGSNAENSSPGSSKSQPPHPHSLFSRLEFYFSQWPFLSSFLIAACLLAFNMAFFRPHFQTNDDTSALLLFKGVGLDFSPNERSELQNLCLGFVLKALYTYFPRIQWYSCLIIFSLFSSLWAILAAFLLGSHRGFRTLLFLVSSLGLVCFYLTDFQYTQVATFAAEGAFLLFAALWRSENLKFLAQTFVLVLILSFFSIGFRASGFFLIGFVCIPAAVYFAGKSGFSHFHRTILKFFVLLVVFLVFLLGFHRVYYGQGPWKEFSDKFYIQMQDLHEDRYTEYNASTKPVFDSAGWSQLDLYLFLSWYFMDETTYSSENMKKLNEQLPRANKYSQNTFSAMAASPNVQIAAVFLLALLFFLPSKAFPYFSIQALWVLLAWFLLMTFMRMPERVFLPPLLFLKDMAIFLAVPKDRNQGGESGKYLWTFKAGVACLALLSLFTVFYLTKESDKNRNWCYNESILKASMDSFHPSDDQLYTIWDSAFPFELIGALDNFEAFRHFHILMLAGGQRSPHAYAMMEHFGVNHLFRDMVDNPHLLLICSSYEMNLYKAYMMEKYQMETNFEPAFTSPAFPAYTIHSVKASGHPSTHPG